MSIYLYDAGSSNYDNNGLCTLIPLSCTVAEQGNSQYELELVHPITEDMRWQSIQRGCVIKAPVPQMETPAIQLRHEGTPGTPAVPGRDIWRVRITTSHAGGYSRIYQRASTNSKILQKLREGTEYEYLGEYNGAWHRAVSSEGVSGYMYTDNSVHVRTEDEIPAKPGIPGYSTVVQPRQVRDQLFRIYEVTKDAKQHCVTARARHISYDLIGNIARYECEQLSAAAALPQLFESFVNPHEFSIVTNITEQLSGDWQLKNGIEALLDPDEGIIHQLDAKLVRDNMDLFILKNTVVDRGVTVAYGKNLLGVICEENDADIVTRIIPVGQDEEGNRILLEDVYVDSQYISQYPTIHTKVIEISDAKVSNDMTIEQVYDKLKEAARAEFEKGCDLSDFNMTVDFIHLGDTEEYKAFHDLQQVFLFDTVTIQHSQLGLYAKAQINGYTWDCILERYTGMSIGSIFEVQGAGIAGYQLPASGISGTKLVPGAVDSSRLRDLSVVTAKIQNAAITSAKIGTAAIETAHIKDASIDSAKIREAAIEAAHIKTGAIESAHLGTAIVDTANIRDAAITGAKIKDGEIDHAKIGTAAIETANIKDAAITSAKIGAAAVDTANIKDAAVISAKIASAAIDTAHVKDAAIGTAQIKDLSVTGAKIAAAAIESLHVSEAAIESAHIQDAAIVDAHIQDAAITAAKIQDLTATILRAVTASIGQVTAGTVETNELYAGLISAVAAELRRVTAGTVETNELYAQVIRAVTADLDRIAASEIKTRVIQAVSAEINKLDAGELYAGIIGAVQADIDMLAAGRLHAALAALSRAEIRDARIDFAHIEDLNAEKAIFTRGVGGELYIADLAVTEANMVRLTLGELVLKGVDGKFYSLSITDEGEIVPVEKQVTGENIANETLGGEKLIEGSITASKLNVGEIFASEALIGVVTADNLDVDTLFASDAFIGNLKTHLIQSDYLSVIISEAQDVFEDLKTFFDFTKDELIIRKSGSEFSVRISTEQLGFFQGGQRIAYFSNSQMFIPRATVTETLTIGACQWMAEKDGSLSLVWAG